MDMRTVLRLVGVVVGLISLAQLPPLLTAFALAEPWRPFAISIGIGVTLMAVLLLFRRGERASLDHRSGFMAVTACWVAGSLMAAVPFLNHPLVPLSAADAIFEATSGLTTTGATILTGLDTMPRSILLWRSISQWLGGMGVVVLGIAVFPILGLGGMQLFKAEAPGPTKDKLTPRIADTARVLWVLYVGITVTCAVLMRLGGMTIFDAICHSMTTIATAGFSTHDQSLGFYDSTYLHVLTTFFMLLGGTSFAILHRAITHGVQWRESPELRTYLGIFTIATIAITLNLRFDRPDEFGHWSDALEHGMFQAASILTTTGYTTQDYDAWPAFAKTILLTLFFVGGMAGSTAGGIKVIRVLLVVRLALAQFFKLVHPHGYGGLKLGERVVHEQVVVGVLGFLAMWFFVLMSGTAILTALGSDVWTAYAASAVTLGNIGPGLGGVGPAETFAPFSDLSKYVLAALMILGRLEIYTALIILTPGFWRR